MNEEMLSDGRCRLVLGLVALAAIGGCSTTRAPEPLVFDEALFATKPHVYYDVPIGADGQPLATVVGKLRRYRVRGEDTFLEVARYFDVGFNELVAANPGMDPWVPPDGAQLLVPTQWVLPCCQYEGLVVNIPEMRLYYFEPTPAGHLRVYTYPVGIGREDRRTPRGVYSVQRKTENPTWVIPESIRREHIRERGDHRRSIAGGDPENPLGKYRLTLSKPRYAIHGTNIPWGPGMPVSHGCVRLYPEDIERLYPNVPVGERVELTYQPVKIGRARGRTYVEVHEDIYQAVPLTTAAADALRHTGTEAIPADRLEAVLDTARGVPIPVMP